MNIHSKKKSCNKCMAGKSLICNLGYITTKKAYDEYGFTAFLVPEEKCPKPLTISDYIFAHKWYKK